MITLTEKEQNLVNIFLKENGCGAKTPGELLEDNFSCQIIQELRDFTNLSVKALGGVLSSLQEKDVIMLEERTNDPDLYWVTEYYLETLDSDEKF